MDELKLIEKGPYFLTFDWYTPRPHMIIVAKPGSDKKYLKSMIPQSQDPNMEMTEEEKISLTEIAKDAYERAKNKFGVMEKVPGVKSPAILSLHFGNWFAKSISKHFHAHVCIDISVYEKWIKEKRDDKILRNKLAQTKTPTLENYLEKAKQTPKDYSKYDIEDLKEVLKQQNPGDGKLRDDKAVQIAFHPKYLRLGFVSKENENVKLLKEMDDFIVRHGLHKQNGGTICIDLANEGFPDYKSLTDGKTVPQADVKGYLQLDGKAFGMLLRAFGKGQEWLANDHSGTDMAVYT